MKKILLALLVIFAYTNSFGQCTMKQISLNQRAENSDLIVEGKVTGKNSFWNTDQTMIYTSNIIEVYKLFKGGISTASIEILTMGGTVGYDRVIAQPSLSLNIGDIGVFTCENVKRFTIPNAERSSLPSFEAYASVQGFVKYNVIDHTASDPFNKYTNIESELYNKILSPTFSTWKTIAPFDINAIGQ